MTTPINRALSKTPPAPKEIDRWITHELLPVALAMRTIINEESTALVTGDVTSYEWDLDLVGILFLEPTGSGLISVDPRVELSKLRAGRRYLLHVTNETGGDITMTFSSDFNANAPVIPDGTTACWEFLVMHPDSAATAKLQEI
jgi:hypothetical protein